VVMGVLSSFQSVCDFLIRKGVLYGSRLRSDFVKVPKRDSVGKLTSGPRFKARKVSLCSHSFGGAVKSTQRMGTFSFCTANVTHTARVSGSAFVLSDSVSE
jgi:hypothetical protein